MSRRRRPLPLLGRVDRPDGHRRGHGPLGARPAATSPTLDELPAKRPSRSAGVRPHACWPRRRPGAPSVCSTTSSIRAFNELWFRKRPRQRTRRAAEHPRVLPPARPRRAAGTGCTAPRGFLQWQLVVPVRSRADPPRRRRGAELRRGVTSFLAVLKRFGPGNAGPLSFPIPGLDAGPGHPGRQRHELGRLLDDLDRTGGRRRRARLPGQGQPAAPRARAASCTPASTSGARSAPRLTPTERCAATCRVVCSCASDYSRRSSRAAGARRRATDR